MSKEDLTIKSTDGRTSFGFESKEAKSNFLRDIGEMVNKSELIESEGYTCGNCAAYPCFRHTLEEARAGLCYQEVRQCRQECNDFIQDNESGKSPHFQITGNCKKDNSFVFYNTECRFLEN